MSRIINNLKDFIDYLYTQVRNHSIYVWGTREMTVLWTKSHRSKSNEQRSMRTVVK